MCACAALPARRAKLCAPSKNRQLQQLARRRRRRRRCCRWLWLLGERSRPASAAAAAREPAQVEWGRLVQWRPGGAAIGRPSRHCGLAQGERSRRPERQSGSRIRAADVRHPGVCFVRAPDGAAGGLAAGPSCVPPCCCRCSAAWRPAGSSTRKLNLRRAPDAQRAGRPVSAGWLPNDEHGSASSLARGGGRLLQATCVSLSRSLCRPRESGRLLGGAQREAGRRHERAGGWLWRRARPLQWRPSEPTATQRPLARLSADARPRSWPGNGPKVSHCDPLTCGAGALAGWLAAAAVAPLRARERQPDTMEVGKNVGRAAGPTDCTRRPALRSAQSRAAAARQMPHRPALPPPRPPR